MTRVKEGIRKKAEATRSKLIDAAVKVIGVKGYSGATVDDIAEEAGVSKGVVYYHFKTKADIATSVLVGSLGTLAGNFEDILAAGGTPHELLDRMLRVFAHRIYTNKEASRFILTELWRPDRLWTDEMQLVESRLITVIEKTLRLAVQEGSVRSDADSRFLTVSIIGMVLASAQYYLLSDETVGEGEFADRCIDFISHAVRA